MADENKTEEGVISNGILEINENLASEEKRLIYREALSEKSQCGSKWDIARWFFSCDKSDWIKYYGSVLYSKVLRMMWVDGCASYNADRIVYRLSNNKTSPLEVFSSKYLDDRQKLYGLLDQNEYLYFIMMDKFSEIFSEWESYPNGDCINQVISRNNTTYAERRQEFGACSSHTESINLLRDAHGDVRAKIMCNSTNLPMEALKNPITFGSVSVEDGEEENTDPYEEMEESDGEPPNKKRIGEQTFTERCNTLFGVFNKR